MRRLRQTAAVVLVGLLGAVLAYLVRSPGDEVLTETAAPVTAPAEAESSAGDVPRDVTSQRRPAKTKPSSRPAARKVSRMPAASRAEQVAAQLNQQARALASAPPFTVATFNVLGSNHTAPGSTASHFAPARVRMGWSLDHLRRIGASIVGFQELQPDQLTWFQRATKGQYATWPGSTLGYKALPTTIAWKSSEWAKVDGFTVSIPFLRQTRLMPAVLLRHRISGQELWVMNVHNAPGGLQGQRDRARAIEIKSLAQPVASGVPVMVIGDFNERATAYCDFGRKLGLISPRGGTIGPGGECTPPSGRLRVDWILGSSTLAMDSYVEDKSDLVRRITDHAVLRTRVRLPSS